MKVLAGAVVMAVLCGAVRGEWKAPALPEIPGKVFKVTEFGVTNGGDATKGIQGAIDAALKAGGGVVEVPAGEYLVGPLKIGNGINLKLEKGAVLKMLPLEKWPGGVKTTESLISGKGLHDVAITGEGVIDGQGGAWWPLVKKDGDAISRPKMISLQGCDKVLIEGVTLKDSPMFHIAVSKMTNVTVRKVIIRAPASTDKTNPSHNTDACDVSGQHILVEDCDVSVGDDDYTCGGGTSDVMIRRNKYGNGHGVSVGSPTHGGVSDITVADCTFEGTDCGIRIKSDRDRGGTVERMTYKNLKMKDVGIPILIYAAYNAKEKEFRDLTNLDAATAAKYPAAKVGEKTPIYKDIVFENIQATAAKGKRGGLVWGLPEAPVTNLVFKNVEVEGDKPFGIFNAKGVKVEGCKFVGRDGKPNLVVGDAEGEGVK